MASLGSPLSWNDVRADFSGANSAMAGASSSFSNAGNIFSRLADAYYKQLDQEEAKREFDIKQQLEQDKLGLDQEKLGFDKYKYQNDFDYTAGRDKEKDRQWGLTFDETKRHNQAAEAADAAREKRLSSMLAREDEKQRKFDSAMDWLTGSQSTSTNIALKENELKELKARQMQLGTGLSDTDAQRIKTLDSEIAKEKEQYIKNYGNVALLDPNMAALEFERRSGGQKIPTGLSEMFKINSAKVAENIKSTEERKKAESQIFNNPEKFVTSQLGSSALGRKMTEDDKEGFKTAVKTVMASRGVSALEAGEIVSQAMRDEWRVGFNPARLGGNNWDFGNINSTLARSGMLSSSSHLGAGTYTTDEVNKLLAEREAQKGTE